MSKKISEMTPTGEAPATSELALAYNGENYKITPQNLVDSVSTGPALWLATGGMPDLVLGQGVTSTSYLGSAAGIGIGFRAAMLTAGPNQQSSHYLTILPSNPSLYNNTNQSLGNLVVIGGITQQGKWELTDGGPDYQMGWIIDLGPYANRILPVYTVFVM